MPIPARVPHPVQPVQQEVAQLGVVGESPQPSVSVDEVTGGRLAATHLVEIGRTDIAFVGGPLGIRQVADRLEGAGSVVCERAEATLEVVNVTNRTVAGGREVAHMLASRPPERRPDAIFAVNDLIALGLLQELVLGHGIRVPEDTAVIGYDDVEFGESSLIPLSSIRVPHEGFGHAAVDLLVNEMSEHLEDVSRQTVFQPELVVRASTVGHSPRT